MSHPRSRLKALKWPGKGLLGVFSWLVFIFLVAPLLVVVPISFSGGSYLRFPPDSYSVRWYQTYFGSQSWIDATLLSILVGTVATILSVVLGFLFALGITRGLRRWSGALEKLALAPMIVGRSSDSPKMNQP